MLDVEEKKVLGMVIRNIELDMKTMETDIRKLKDLLKKSQDID